MSVACPYCHGMALHAGDVIAIEPTVDPQVRTNLTRLAQDRGLQVAGATTRKVPVLTVVASQEISTNPASVDVFSFPSVVSVRQAQRLLRHMCLQGVGEHSRTSPTHQPPLGARDSTQIPVLPPTATGLPHRTLFNRPWPRDPLVWVGLGLITLTLASAPLVVVRLFGSDWSDDPFVLRLDLSGWAIGITLSGLLGFIVWCLVILPAAAIRRSARRRQDQDLLSVPPTDQLPGWRTDPLGQSRERWWNGLSWTGSLQPPPKRSGQKLAPVVVLGIAVVTLSWEASIGLANVGNGTTAITGQPTEASALPSGYASLSDALPQVERALLDYGAATGSDPMSNEPAVQAALVTLADARSVLAAALANASPTQRQAYGRFDEALGSFVTVRQAYQDELRLCSTAEGPTCPEQVRQRWQGQIQATVQPLADAYREILQSRSSE